ncbi:hypothetical protein [Bacteroides sp. 519]|uniref:hypothetical protein n=1 Tax=Bacteroides sp. 519 TaxID=2302937 RepID=UPI0013CF6CC9|nr:hypothetical protein [Bacteroides sp. 519]NDV58073.1 hypothetical protein [Bacteroides sp. 519]
MNKRQNKTSSDSDTKSTQKEEKVIGVELAKNLLDLHGIKPENKIIVVDCEEFVKVMIMLFETDAIRVAGNNGSESFIKALYSGNKIMQKRFPDKEMKPGSFSALFYEVKRMLKPELENKTQGEKKRKRK